MTLAVAFGAELWRDYPRDCRDQGRGKKDKARNGDEPREPVGAALQHPGGALWRRQFHAGELRLPRPVTTVGAIDQQSPAAIEGPAYGHHENDSGAVDIQRNV